MLDFRSIACTLANDREALRGIRSTLRERMAAYVVPVITVHTNFAKLCSGLSFAIAKACAVQSRGSCNACSKNGIPLVIDAVTQAAIAGWFQRNVLKEHRPSLGHTESAALFYLLR